MSDGTTILFGLPGVEVREVHRVASGRVAQVVTADPDAAACPVCGVFSQVVRQRRSTAPRDLGYGEEPLAVRWHKRQYRCGEEACPRTAFTTCTPELPAGARVTGRLRRAAAAVVEGGRRSLPRSEPTSRAAGGARRLRGPRGRGADRAGAGAGARSLLTTRKPSPNSGTSPWSRPAQ